MTHRSGLPLQKSSSVRPHSGRRAGGQEPEGPCPNALELKAGFARGVCQGLDATMVAVARAVESDLLDTDSLGALGNDAANLGSSVGVLAVLQAIHDVGLGGVGSSQHPGAVGGEDLRVQVLTGTQHR